mgnify:CR=1 FL=1
MSREHYLTVQNSSRETYARGRLHLDATTTRENHAFAFYPPPYDKLANFMAEGSMRFEKTGNKISVAYVTWRSNRSYDHASSYILNFNNDGGYEISQWRDGTPFAIAAYSSSSLFNRGETSENTFRIVAYGSLFDIYINDKFLIGFEDEYLDLGTIGLFTGRGCYVTFDDIKIWDAILK